MQEIEEIKLNNFHPRSLHEDDFNENVKAGAATFERVAYASLLASLAIYGGIGFLIYTYINRDKKK